MRKIISMCTVMMIIIVNSCNHVRPNLDSIYFSNVDSVERAIIELDTLMLKVKIFQGLPNYQFSPRDGFKINNIQIRDDEYLCKADFEKDIFDALTPEEKQKLRDNIMFLKQNNITGARPHIALWQFRYELHYSHNREYGEVSVSRIYDEKDTLSDFFRNMQKILDRKGGLILFTLSDTFKSWKSIRIPLPPKKINPYDSINIDQH